MLIQRGYKTEIDPNNKQKTLLAKNAGAARFAYNWALNVKQEAFTNRDKIPNAIELHRNLVELKQTDFPWMYECSKCSPQEALRNLDLAFANFFRRCKQKKGKKGFPRFKSKKNGLGSFRLYKNIKIFERYIQLPKIGKVKLKERNYLPQEVKIINATVSEKAGRWFVSILVEQEQTIITKPQNIIGLDLGIKTLATCSNGQIFDNPRALKKNLNKLQRLSRWMSRRVKGGQNRKKARKKLAALHYRIACIRKDCLHKLTTYLTKTKSKIVLEDLNVSGMMKNRHLSRAIADIGLFEARRQLEYKGRWYNCEIEVVDRFYPSSKICSRCGQIKKDLALSERTYKCDGCDLEIDRDLNAAVNLLEYSTVGSAGINAFGEKKL